MIARLVLLLVALLPLVSTAQEPKPGPFDIIIVGGGKTEAEAQAALDRLREKVLWVRLAHYPAVHKSDEYPGLKKGLYIAVLGLCPRESREGSKALVKAVSAIQPGTYSRTIKGQYGNPCPPLSAFEPAKGEEKALLDRIAKEPRSADAYYQYALFLKEGGRLDEASVMADHALELDPNLEDAKELAKMLMVLLTE